MKFRWTVTAACLLLAFLSFFDLRLWFQNPEPEVLSISAVQAGKRSRAWLSISDAEWDLEKAISTSGTLEMEGLLVPLRVAGESGDAPVRVLLETREPELVGIFSKYALGFDDVASQKEFLEKNSARFRFTRAAKGLVMEGLLMRSRQHDLKKVAEASGTAIVSPVLFITENKEPPTWRGLFFAVVALLGIVRLWLWPRNKKSI